MIIISEGTIYLTNKILFFINLFNILILLINLILSLNKIKKVRSDKIMIISRLLILFFLGYSEIFILGNGFLTTIEFNKEITNQHVSCIVYCFLFLFNFSTFTEYNHSFCDVFYMIDYVLNRKKSIFKDFIFSIIIFIPSLLMDIIYSIDKDEGILKFIYLQNNFPDISQKDFFFISYNPIIVIFNLMLLILSIIELYRMLTFFKNIKFKSSHRRFLRYIHLSQFSLILFLVIYCLSYIILLFDIGNIMSQSNLIQYILTIVFYSYITFENIFILLINGNSDYFYYEYGFTYLGKILSFLLGFEVIDPDLIDKTNFNFNSNDKISLEESVILLNDLSGFNFDTHHINILNNFMNMLFKTLLKALPEVINLNKNITKISSKDDLFTLNNNANKGKSTNNKKNEFKYENSKKKKNQYKEQNCSIHNFSLYDIFDGVKDENEESLFLNEMVFIKNSTSNLYSNSNENNKKEGFINDYASKISNEDINQNDIKLISIYNTKLLKFISDDIIQIQNEIRQLIKSIENHQMTYKNFLVYFLSILKNGNESIGSYKNLKFGLNNKHYYFQFIEDDNIFLNFIENYILYRANEGFVTFLEDIVGAYKIQIKNLPPVNFIILKNKFIAPSLIPNEYYHMWQILKLNTETIKYQGGFKVISSSHSKNIEKNEKSEYSSNNEIVVKENSFHSNFVYDPNALIMENNKFELVKFDKFNKLISKDINFLKSYGIKDLSLKVLYYELGKISNSVKEMSFLGKNERQSIKATTQIGKFAFKLNNISKNLSGIYNDDRTIYDEQSEEDMFIKGFADKTTNEYEMPLNAYTANLIDYKCILFFCLDINNFDEDRNKVCCGRNKNYLDLSEEIKTSYGICYSHSNKLTIAHRFLSLFNCLLSYRINKRYNKFKEIIINKFSKANYPVEEYN